MSREFDGRYATVGRPSIPPERLLRAQLLQMFYSIRSERLLMEQLEYNLLFRWFVGMEMDEPVWNVTVFTKNRDRLLNQEIACSFCRRVVERAQDLMSDEHFTVDGTLIEAWASQKSFQRTEGGTDSDGRDFRGQQRTNDTHVSKTDPDARLYRRSHHGEARLSYVGHVLIENRHGLIRPHRVRRPLRCIGEAPTVWRSGLVSCRPASISKNTGPARVRSNYVISQHARPRIEPAFGWLKTIAWMRKVKLRGLAKVDWLFVFASAAFKLIRLPKLLPRPA